VIAVLLLVSVGGSWAFLRFMGKEKSADSAAPEQTENGQGGSPGVVQAQYLQLDPNFLANFNVNGRQRYLQVSLAVKTRDPAALAAMQTHMPLIRNRLVMLLSGESFEQLQTDEGRVSLQQKLLDAVREILQKETGKADIEQVLFTSFVMT
jgi:flagellar FliL protein